MVKYFLWTLTIFYFFPLRGFDIIHTWSFYRVGKRDEDPKFNLLIIAGYREERPTFDLQLVHLVAKQITILFSRIVTPRMLLFLNLHKTITHAVGHNRSHIKVHFGSTESWAYCKGNVSVLQWYLCLPWKSICCEFMGGWTDPPENSSFGTDNIKVRYLHVKLYTIQSKTRIKNTNIKIKY